MKYSGITWEPCFGHTGKHWLAWLAGRLFRLRRGPTPDVPQWNGPSPYCKALDLGLDQTERIEWEIGWTAEHERLGTKSDASATPVTDNMERS